MKRILVLFPKDWDRAALDAQRYRSRYCFHFEGFDLFRFPENARLLAFDARRFVDALAAKYRRIGIDGVISNNEQFGALAAAAVARRLGLPGTDPLAVVTAQHKYYARRVLREAVPEATPRFALFPYDIRDRSELDLGLPCFVKPVKATFSVLARRIASFAELRGHLRFGLLERLLIRRLVAPFSGLASAYAPLPVDACNMIAEEILEGRQVNVDGYVERGEVRLLGMVDAVMYPGTDAFMRFEYPSRLPEAVQARIAGLAGRALRAMNYDHGFFNAELVYDPGSGRIGVIEVNPRMASQLANLYERVDGYDPYAQLLALAVGETPSLRRAAGAFSTAASFVFRRFDGRGLRRVPSASRVAAALARHPDARVMFYAKRGAALAREMKWLGSHRYAVLNLGGHGYTDLYARCHEIRRALALD